MEKNVFEGLELQFSEFPKDMQEKLYLQNRERFEKDAARSQFDEIRRLVIENEQSSSSVLDEVFKAEVEQYLNSENIKLLKDKTNFQMNNEKRKKFAESRKWWIRLIAAKDEASDSEFLNKMLQDEIEGNQDYEVIEAILNNINFKMKDETRKMLAKAEYGKYRQMAAKDEASDSEFLNQMLQDEINGVINGIEDDEVIEAILNNPNFKMNENTRKMLAKAKDGEHRQMAAKDEASDSEFLNQMLQDEINGVINGIEVDEVIEAILNNPNFKMNENTRKMLAKAKDCEYRQMAAKDKGSSTEFLNQMLEDEINGDEDDEVIEAILNNINFKMKDETRKMFAKAKDGERRQMAAKDKGSSTEFLNQMLEDEINGFGVLEVIEAILNNINFKMQDKTREKLAKANKTEYRQIAANYKGASIEFLENMYLEEDDENVIKVIERSIMKKRIIQKQQISKALKEFKDSNTSAQECLYRILEIIC